MNNKYNKIFIISIVVIIIICIATYFILDNTMDGFDITTTTTTTTTTSHIDIQKKKLKKAYDFTNSVRFSKINNQLKLDTLNKRVNTLLTKLNTTNVAYTTPDSNPMIFY